jgi:hypothetical protein
MLIIFFLCFLEVVVARNFVGHLPPDYQAGVTLPTGSVSQSSIKKREGLWDPNFEIESKYPTKIDLAVQDLGIKDFDLSDLVAVANRFVNATKEDIAIVVEAIEHPIRTLSHSWLGLCILLILGCFFLAGLIRIMIPIGKAVLAVIRFVGRTSAYLSCCALGPCVRLRNYIRKKQINRANKRNVIYGRVTDDREEVEMVTRRVSPISYDTRGPYVTSSTGERIYAKEGSVLNLVSPTRLREEQVEEPVHLMPVIHKESLIPGSKFYKEKMPKWQGQFDIDGTIIGHFCRIKFHKRDCLLTASHVLSFNKTANVRLRKDDKYAYLSSIATEIVAYSSPEELDFVIMTVPDFVFSQLGISVGKTTSKVRMGEVVNIRQIVKDEQCVSTAVTRVVRGDPWRIQYGASTITSSSGAPLCNARGEIFGVHTGCDRIEGVNLGVVIPLFRVKESDMNEDAYNDLDLEEEDAEKRAERLVEDEEAEELRLRILLRRPKGEVPVDASASWAEQMEEIDRYDDEDYADFENYRRQFRVVKTIVRSKAGKKRFESPWTCSKCQLLHLEAGLTCRRPGCGFALVKDKQKIKENKAEIAEGSKLALEELMKTLPLVVLDEVRKALKKEGELAKELDQFVKELIDQRHSRWTNEPKLSKIPERVEAVEGEIHLGKGVSDPSFAVLRNQLVKLPTGKMNEKRSLEEGAIALEKCSKEDIKAMAERGDAEVVCKVKAVTPSAPKPPSRKARRNKRVSQETKETVIPAVPLNSQSPATAGVPTTSGLNRKSSPQKATSLATVQSNSTSPKLLKRIPVGNVLNKTAD